MTNDYEQLDALGKRARERLQAITPGQGGATLPLDDKFMVTRALMQEVAALRTENMRLRNAACDVINAVEWEDDRQSAYIHLGEWRYGWSTDEPIKHPLKRAITELRNALKGHADE